MDGNTTLVLVVLIIAGACAIGSVADAWAGAGGRRTKMAFVLHILLTMLVASGAVALTGGKEAGVAVFGSLFVADLALTILKIGIFVIHLPAMREAMRAPDDANVLIDDLERTTEPVLSLIHVLLAAIIAWQWGGGLVGLYMLLTSLLAVCLG